MHGFDWQQIVPTRWKNGGGSTREIACGPRGAGLDDFGWRISVAEIAKAGPFSVFPGIDRHIMLLEGDGVQLHSSAAGIDHALAQRWQPFAFAGDVALSCSLLGGPSTDFNVMTRRGLWSAQVQVVQQAQLLGVSPAGLVMVLQGQWRRASAAPPLLPGQGCWWSASDAGSGLLVPQSGDARLVHVALHPAQP
ncbi:HutD family protein [Comamonas sp. GB3 AK4-5]|uniref:HutD/Ves family protein n=1 Tax=Comamonas sp. GB3 AK4-5 TaxID=3231487 RepID=UPI00351EF6DB